MNNVDGADGYAGLGDEIWQQTAGQVDALVHTVSTAHSLHGMSRALRGYSPTMPVYAVEPLGVGNDMALAALDLLAGIIATQTGNVRGLC